MRTRRRCDKYFFLVVCCVLVLLLTACISAQATSAPPTTVPASAPQATLVFPTSAPAPAAGSSGLILTSTAFTDGGNIPVKYSCQGEKTSPELRWSGAPAQTKSFVLLVQDPDAPSGTFIHWVAFDIPVSQTEIPEGAQTAGVSGKNSAGQNSYVAPCPPSGTHRYIFSLYAVEIPSLTLQAGATQDQVMRALAGHILAQATLTGRYAKQ